jgi:hypothetical protein
MKNLSKKWVIWYTTYENGEEVCSDSMTYRDRKGVERDIIFDTAEEATAYMNENLDHCYCTGYISEMNVYDNSSISYAEVKKIQEEAAERRRLYLMPCPFCGDKPERVDQTVKCNNCNIILPQEKWNNRK